MIVAVSLMAGAASATQTNRLALVIGNADYPGSAADLSNTGRDAALLSDTLRDIGFDVSAHSDLGREAIFKEIDLLAKKATDDSVIFVFFAGHGIQVDGENYLIPTDQFPQSLGSVPESAVPVAELIDRLTLDTNATLILVLDACRNNPFGGAGSRDGLAIVRTSRPDVMIAFSTSPGQVAYDGLDGGNSPYSSALADSLQKPGLSIESEFKRARSRVIGMTGHAQIPWENSSLRDEVYLVPDSSLLASAPTKCDLMAGHPTDPDRVHAGVAYRLLRPEAAIEACRADLAKDPDNPRLMTQLARALEKGGAFDEAVRLNQQAKERFDYLGAYHNLGNLYRKGGGVERDLGEAFHLFLYAAERGHPEDAYNIGNFYARGRGPVEEDFRLARVWLERSASQDYPSAFDKLGLLYLNGQGVDENIILANRYFARGAELGDPSALVNLANSYRRGTGVEVDYEKALELYERAARLRRRSAYVNLGDMYRKGQGVEPDPLESAFWYGLASRAGHEGSQKRFTEAMKSFDEADQELVRDRIEAWLTFEFG